MANEKKTTTNKQIADTAKIDIEDSTQPVFSTVQTKFEAYTGEEPYIFISYSHRDQDVVYPILDALYDRKYRIWYDESCETGNDFRDELRQRIEGCDAVILFVSRHSMTSPFCGMEIIVARENDKRIYPIYIEDNVVPPAFEILLANTHHCSASNMEKLVRSMIRDLPATTMDRLTTVGEVLKRCEDNGASINVDEGICIIDSDAFRDRVQLRQVILPNSLKAIEKEAFRGCRNLEGIVIPHETIRIGESSFRDCVHMKVLSISNDKVKIGERAFENCAELENITLPDGLTEIYGGVFNSCRSLRSITLPSQLTILGESAFSDCTGLEQVQLPSLVTKIDDLVFNGCERLTSLQLNDGLKKIGKSAFKNCKQLTEMFIPASVNNIGDAPFRGCEDLKSIRVAPRNKYYKSEPSKREGNDHVLFNKNKSILIAYPASSREVQYDVPDSVTIISDWAFCSSRKLNRITIPDSVYEIGEGAFSGCALLDELEIPDSVTKIDDCAFRNCLNLERITIPSSVKELGWGLFDGCEERVSVYCDENSPVEEYCIRNGIHFEHVTDKDDF